MPLPNAATAPFLRTDADVMRRVEQLVGTTITDRQLWVMLLDGDSRQAPVIMPVSDMPRHPQSGGLAGLGEVLTGLRGELTTDLGPGSVILTLERLGTDAVLPVDREWADALAAACERAGITLRGVFLATVGRVRRLS